MSHLHDVGEEYGIKNGLEATYSVLLYDDSTDNLSDSDDLGDITTEPDDAQTYARQPATFSYETVDADGASTTDSDISFDMSGNSQDVDSWGLAVSFQSARAGDGSVTDHLIASGRLGEDIDGGSTDSVPIGTGEIGVGLD